jgi:hypothetical protein
MRSAPAAGRRFGHDAALSCTALSCKRREQALEDGVPPLIEKSDGSTNVLAVAQISASSLRRG